MGGWTRSTTRFECCQCLEIYRERETVRCPPRQLVSQEGLEGPLEARTTRQRKPALQHITSGTRSSSSSSSGGYPTHL